MNKRPYHIKDEDNYNSLLRETKRLSIKYKEYWTVIWSKQYNCWYMTCMKRDGTGLVDKM
jgi:hypothetical protein